MLTRDQLKGVIPPVVTPLDRASVLDEAGLERVVAHLIEGGVDGLFVLGSTGEGPSLSDREASKVIEETVRLVNGRLPVLAGVSDSSVERTLEKARRAEALGADAVVATVPSYYPIYSDEEISGYFRYLADEAPLPVVIYNIPPATQITIRPEVLLSLSSVPSILGVKDSSGDWAHFQQLLFQREDTSFRILQGKESHSGASLLFGADGLVPGISNIRPRLASQLYQAGTERDIAAVAALQQEMNALCRIFEGRPWLPAMKTAMHVLGLCGATAAHPFEPLDEDDVHRIEAILADCGLDDASVHSALERDGRIR